MPTSNSNPQPSAATDSPLGAPTGNEPYKTIRMTNVANPETNAGMSDTKISSQGAEAQDMTKTQMIGNIAGGTPTQQEPKPAQGA